MGAKVKDIETAWRFMFRNDDGSGYNEYAKTAIADLRRFCKGMESVYSDNALQMARMAGRQEVFNKIMNLLEIDSKQLSHIIEEIDYYD